MPAKAKPKLEFNLALTPAIRMKRTVWPNPNCIRVAGKLKGGQVQLTVIIQEAMMKKHGFTCAGNILCSLSSCRTAMKVEWGKDIDGYALRRYGAWKKDGVDSDVDKPEEAKADVRIPYVELSKNFHDFSYRACQEISGGKHWFVVNISELPLGK